MLRTALRNVFCESGALARTLPLEKKTWKQFRAGPQILLVDDDVGEVLILLTKHYRHIFAVLNLANALRCGGGAYEGGTAQEEQIFKRSTAHFMTRSSFLSDVIFKETDLVEDSMLVDFHYPLHARKKIRGYAKEGVELETAKLRVLSRCGPQNAYAELPPEEHVPFFEIRNAFPDMDTEGEKLLPAECRGKFM